MRRAEREQKEGVKDNHVRSANEFYDEWKPDGTKIVSVRLQANVSDLPRNNRHQWAYNYVKTKSEE